MAADINSDDSQLISEDNDALETSSQDEANYGTINENQFTTDREKMTGSIILLTILSAIGGFLFGYDTGVISGAMLALKDVFHLSYLWQELIVSVTIGAAALAAIGAGPLNDLCGRRFVILMASFIFTAGALVMGLTNTKELLLVGRLIVGLGIGLASMTVPMYISECAPAHLRGKLTVVNNLFITGGQMFASILDGILFTDHKNGWRYMLGLAGIPSLIQFVGFLFMPESPRWLVIKGRDEEARHVLTRLLGPALDASAQVKAIRRGHLASIRVSRSRDDSTPVLCRMLRHSPTRRALVLGCVLQAVQQLAGINTVMYYSATIVQMAGVHAPQSAVWAAAGIAAVNFLFTVLGVLLVDRLGRRRLTLGSLLGVMGSLALLATAFQVTAVTSPAVERRVEPPANLSSDCFRKSRCSDCVNRQDCGFCFSLPPPSSALLAVNGSCLPTRVGFGKQSLYGPCVNTTGSGHRWAYDYCPSVYSWLAILGMVLYLAFFAPGMGPMPWTVNSEIYPTWARSTGVACSTGVNWIFNLIVAMTFLTLTQSITRYGTFWLYTAIVFLGFLFLSVTLPETRGRTLEQIEKLFEKPWNFKPC